MIFITSPSCKERFEKIKMSNVIKNIFYFRSYVLIPILSISFIADAQELKGVKDNKETVKPSRKIETVFVTSNKLGSSSLQELPATVKLLTGDDFKKRGVLDFLDFSGSVPGLLFEDSGPGDREYIIRGINSTGASAVGVYYDDIPITATNSQDGGGRNMDIKLIDMDKVEVFNGPQGTQYGANSMSGLVRYVPEKPNVYQITGSIEADVATVKYGGENRMLNGVANIPLVNGKLALRLVGWTVENDGWIDMVRSLKGVNNDEIVLGLTENVNDESTVGGRVLLRYLASDELSFDFTYLKQSMDIGGSSEYVPDGKPIWGLDGGFPSSDNIELATEGDYKNYDIGISPWNEDLDLAMLSINYEFISGRLTTNISHWERDIYYTQDGTTGSLESFVPVASANVQPQNRSVQFLEVRYSSDFDGSVQFLLGASKKDEKNYWQIQGVLQNPLTGRPHDFIPGPDNNFFSVGGNVVFNSIANTFIDQEAIFSEILYEASDDLTFTLGARYFSSEKEVETYSRHPARPKETSSPDNDSKTTGKLSVSYQVISDINVYTTISQGFRVGGVNVNPEETIPDTFEPDFLTNYELGFKTQLFDDNITFNGAFYNMQWQDIQVQTFAEGQPYIANAGEASVSGFEFNISSYLTDSFLLDVSGSIVDATLTKDQPPVGDGLDRGFSGDEVPNVPNLQAYVGLEYLNSLNFGELTIRGDLTYRGSANTRFNTDSEYNYDLDSNYIVNVRASFAMEPGWSGTFYINNVLNTVADYDAIVFDNEQLGVFGSKPRTVGIRLGKSF